MSETPGQHSRTLVRAADTDFRKGKIAEARTKITEAFVLRDEVERYNGARWWQNHQDFTEAMLDMAVLWYKLGKFKLGTSIAARAQAWADDPNCSSQNKFDRSFSVRKQKIWHFVSGLPYWFRAAFPA